MLVESIKNSKGIFNIFLNEDSEYEVRVVVKNKKEYPKGKLIKTCRGREEYREYKKILLRDT